MKTDKSKLLPIFLALLRVIFWPVTSLAEGMMSGDSCMMCSMGRGGMILGTLLGIALLAMLIALAVFLFRRSRGGGHV